MNMPEIIDLSQEIFAGMPVFHGLPTVHITMHVSHEEWDGIFDSDIVSPAVNRLELGEHTGTHVDALNHMARQYRGHSIETMPLAMFYTQGICLDLSHKSRGELIEVVDLEQALSAAGLKIEPGDTVLLYTDHYRRAFGTEDWYDGPGISAQAARWLGQQGIALSTRQVRRHLAPLRARWRRTVRSLRHQQDPTRVAAARAKGDVDVWLRVDYQPGQTLPPTGRACVRA